MEIHQRLYALLEKFYEAMTLTGENPFRTKAFTKAAEWIEENGAEINWLKEMENGTLDTHPTIGKGIAEILTEFLKTGYSKTLEGIEAKIPKGVRELMRVPGLGPKKAKTLVEALGITTLDELEKVCRENRLPEVKGFTQQTQADFLEKLERLKNDSVKCDLPNALEFVEECKSWLQENHPEWKWMLTGQVHRALEIVDCIEFLVDAPAEKVKAAEAELGQFMQEETPVKIRLHALSEKQWGRRSVALSSSEEFLKKINAAEKQVLSAKATEDQVENKLKQQDFSTEDKYFHFLDLPFVVPEARERADALLPAKRSLIELKQVRGFFHFHTTRSDGRNSLKQMVEEASKQGYEYVGVSEHSQTATYAGGLREEDILDQKKEIAEVQKLFPNVRIFHGIESDILADGSLDYPEKILKQFDFVVASVHMRHKMNSEQMTQRLQTVMKNPYTTFIGHLSGRILLERPPFDFDVEAVFRTAGETGTIIELNASPSRLDVDWRYGAQLEKNGVQVSIHPDAHEIDGISDMKWGVLMARKAAFTPAQVLNTKSVTEMEAWLKQKRA